MRSLWCSWREWEMCDTLTANGVAASHARLQCCKRQPRLDLFPPPRGLGASLPLRFLQQPVLGSDVSLCCCCCRRLTLLLEFFVFFLKRGAGAFLKNENRSSSTANTTFFFFFFPGWDGNYSKWFRRHSNGTEAKRRCKEAKRCGSECVRQVGERNREGKFIATT